MIALVVIVLAMVVGVSFGLAAFGLAFAMLFQEILKRQESILKSELSSERSLRLMAQTEAEGIKKTWEAQSNAIEANALPWVAKNDRIEARYENEAIDRLENPSFYNDVVEGLGGTR